MSSGEYLLNSAAWFLGGAAVSSVYWRWYVHRKLVALGTAKKETPLASFTAALVVVVVSMGLLFGEANRIELQKSVKCQRQIDQKNVDTINDRSKGAITQLQSELRFYQSLAVSLSRPPNMDIRSDVLVKLRRQIEADQTRLTQIKNNPLQPVSSCATVKDSAAEK